MLFRTPVVLEILQGLRRGRGLRTTNRGAHSFAYNDIAN